MKKQVATWKVVALCSVIGAAAVMAAGVMTVNVPMLEVWSRKASMFGKVATLKQGETFQVIQKDNDGWLRVAVGDTEGFVKESANLPPKTDFSEAFKGMKLSRTEAADPSASMAARGIGQGTTFYADAKGYRLDGLDEMIAAREAVIGTRFQLFIGEGNIGPAK